MTPSKKNYRFTAHNRKNVDNKKQHTVLNTMAINENTLTDKIDDVALINTAFEKSLISLLLSLPYDKYSWSTDVRELYYSQLIILKELYVTHIKKIRIFPSNTYETFETTEPQDLSLSKLNDFMTYSFKFFALGDSWSLMNADSLFIFINTVERFEKRSKSTTSKIFNAFSSELSTVGTYLTSWKRSINHKIHSFIKKKAVESRNAILRSPYYVDLNKND